MEELWQIRQRFQRAPATGVQHNRRSRNNITLVAIFLGMTATIDCYRKGLIGSIFDAF
jgi:hypothetical protein